MTALETIKNSLIDRILATRNERLLEAVKTIFDATDSEDTLTLSSEQIEMLKMSDDDILNNRVVSQSELDKMDSEWGG